MQHARDLGAARSVRLSQLQLLLCLIAPWTAPVAQGSSSPAAEAVLEPLVFVELELGSRDGAAGSGASTPEDTYFVHEPVALVVRVGFGEDAFRDSLLPLFRRPLDLPFQLAVPWLADLPGASVLSSGAGGGPSFALNDGLGIATDPIRLERDAGAFAVFEYPIVLLPLAAGTLEIPEVALHYAFATRFREDLLGDRVAEDRLEASARSEPLRISVLALPQEGRPDTFTGAVGALSLRASVAPRRLTEGESVKVTLTVAGQGNLEAFEAPPFLDLLGRAASSREFRELGRLDEARGREQRVLTYDVAVLRAQTQALPPLEFVYFDTRPPAGYRSLTSDALALDVRPAQRKADEEHTPATPPTSPGRVAPGLAIGVAGTLLALGTWLLLRRRSQVSSEATRASAPGPNLERAAEHLRALATETEDDLTEPLAAFLAAVLNAPDVDPSPELASRLAERGAPLEEATQAARYLERLSAARYGGSAAATDLDRAELVRLVGELERSLQRR